jgi:hypothetical protein
MMIQDLDRRSLLAAGLSLAAGPALADPTIGPAPARLTLVPGEPGEAIPLDYTGFSVETIQLADPSFYHPDNHSLIALHRRLAPHGVLRIGGNSSEFCWWKATPDTAPPTVRAAGVGRADNWMPQHFTPITPDAVNALRGFLDACGWSCIWGLNFGTGSPDHDAEEAAYVARVLGPRLDHFQIGNEPDFYRNPNNMLRPAGWDFPDYLNEWTAIARAVVARVPDARFGGPDIGSGADWVVRFAREAPARIGPRLVGLSGHYYAEGPPDSPQATIAHLLAGDPRVAARMDAIMPAARAAGLAFRVTEANSCYRGGKPGMSNALASALWGGDYMLDLAARGCRGVNFHGGPGKTIAASNGDKMPGARSAADMEAARLGTFYSPFAGSPQQGFTARPLFYGMMLAQAFVGARLVPVRFETGGAVATAYAARTEAGYRIALFNKDEDRDLRVRLDLGAEAPSSLRKAGAPRTRLWRLTGPSLEATQGVTLAGAEVAPGDAAWSPRTREILDLTADGAVLDLPKASAALLFVEA